MSTCNFAPMYFGMPLVCGGLGNFEDYKSDYEEQMDEEYTENMFFDDLNMEFDEASCLAEDFSDELRFHQVSVKSGYYAGFQFVVDEVCDCGCFDKDSPYSIDNEDAHYYYGECRSKVLRKADAEKKKIRKWLEHLPEVFGPLEILECIGVFSNGEVVYRRKEVAV